MLTWMWHPLEVLEVHASQLTCCVLRKSYAKVIYKINLYLPTVVSFLSTKSKGRGDTIGDIDDNGM